MFTKLSKFEVNFESNLNNWSKMNNLVLFDSYEFKTDWNNYSAVTACSHSDGTVICFICDKNILYFHNVVEDKKITFQITEIERNIKYIQHLPLHRSICLGSETELAVFDIFTKKTKVVQKLEKEILNLAWDSTQSFLVLIDTEHDLHLYSYNDLGIDGSSSLIQNYHTKLTSKVPGSVMVGWGSQNTQFQGPKHRKHKAMQEVKEVSKCFDGPPQISWRGNSEQFVINFYKNGCRLIKVFDKQLNPLFESDEYSSLAEPVSFMGQGQYIACCIVEKNTNNLVIFEKNCKVKTITELKETQGSVMKILFNPQMNVLGIQSRDAQQNSFLDIFLYSNAHWFLKQQLYYPTSNKINDFFWMETSAALFTICKLVIFTNEEVCFHTFKFVTNTSPVKAIAAVIDGKLLNMHLFENAIIPPPMSSYVFEHTRPINSFFFHPQKPFCMLVDSQFELSFIHLENNSVGRLISSRISSCGKRPKFVQIDWTLINEINVYVESADEVSTYEEIIDNIIFRIIKTKTRLSNSSDTEYLNSDKPLDNAHILLYHARAKLKVNDDTLNFDISLNACQDLCINSKRISSGVTSCLLYKKYLLWTTATGMLYCIRDKQFGNHFDVSRSFVRPIEQGARIVCCTNVTPPSIILQLPRGNLETVNCKMITIDIIDDLLSNNRWRDALQIMRIEKINSNVVVDLNPERFLDNIENFVKAAKSCSILTAIVSNFDLEENCFQTVYRYYLENQITESNIKKKNIVEKILDFLCSKNCVENLSCIVAIQQKHISLKSALISVKQVYEANVDKHELICNKTIRLILQQAHLKDVLNAAFTLFDLRLLALIYRNSNEDPKVYEPELSNLHNMSSLERRFRLCLKAHNPISAVKYLLLSDEFDEEYVVSFIVKNKLEHVAYYSTNKCNSTVTDQFKLASTLYAKRLTIEGKYVEAGLVLKRARLFEESLQQYRKALEWREVIALMNILKYNGNQKMLILECLACELLAKNKLEDAVVLFEYHIQNHKKAIESLVNLKAFRRALSMAKTYNELDYLESFVIPSLLDYTSTLTEKVTTLQKRFDGYVNRLKTVREKRQQNFELAQEDGGLYHSGDDELFSETSSISSGRSSKKTSSSRRSTLSSRNRRKEERKKINLREGGFYEDIALMRVLHMMYEEVYEVTKEVRDVCLIEELGNDGFCKDIHEKLNNLQIEMKQNMKVIWPEVFYKTPLTKDAAIQAIIQNKNDLDPKYSIPPSEELLNDNWKLVMFT